MLNVRVHFISQLVWDFDTPVKGMLSNEIKFVVLRSFFTKLQFFIVIGRADDFLIINYHHKTKFELSVLLIYNLHNCIQAITTHVPENCVQHRHTNRLDFLFPTNPKADRRE